MKHEEEQYNKIKELVVQLKNNQDPFPEIIEIHPTDRCNHRCAYCFHGGIGFDKTREATLLTIEHYDHLFSEMENLHIVHLSIAGGGEPSMDTRLTTILVSARRHGINVRLVTNGNFLTNELQEELLLCSEIRFSIDAYSVDVYAKIRNIPGILLNKTMTNLKELIKARDNRNSSLNVGVTFLLCKDNIHEAKDFCISMLSLGVDAIIIKFDIYGTDWNHGEVNDTLLFLKNLNDPRLDIRELGIMNLEGLACFAPYFKVALNPYGEIFSCCLGSQPGEKNGYRLGNIQENNFEKIWTDSIQTRHTMRTKPIKCQFCNHTDYQINKIMEVLS